MMPRRDWVMKVHNLLQRSSSIRTRVVTRARARSGGVAIRWIHGLPMGRRKRGAEGSLKQATERMGPQGAFDATVFGGSCIFSE